MKPASDFTTPRKLIFPISRHFLPLEHPEPPCCCTTGLKNGSRFPFIAHFFSSGFGAGLAAGVASSATAGAGRGFAATLVVTACLGAGATAFGPSVLDSVFVSGFTAQGFGPG